MRRLALLIALAALVAAPSASAKEIVQVKVCGLDGCVTTHDAAITQGLTDGGPPIVPPPMQGGVISLRSAVSDGERIRAHFTTWWAPSLRMLVTEDGTWMRVSHRSAAAIDRTAAGLEPFPADTIGLTAHAPAPSDDGFDWLLVLIPAAALALVAVLLLLRRRPVGPADNVPRGDGHTGTHRLRPGP
jgi:hypothetical protein